MTVKRTEFQIEEYLRQIVVPEKDSHKGENGRVLVIGGSKLFHASIFWSADVASRIVDLVHFTSPAEENNEIVRKRAKEGFWEGIVVPWERVEEYIEEDDSILVGPGMVRADSTQATSDKPQAISMKEWGEGDKTAEIVNYLLKQYPDKRWVVDGGALQEVDISLLNDRMIVTPHQREFERILSKLHKPQIPNPKQIPSTKSQLSKRAELVESVAKELGGVTILLKGVVDVVSDGKQTVTTEGGNEGMTKGGTGDVLAGLVAALYAKSPVFASASVASYVNKRAGDLLYEEVGPYFNASELVTAVPQVLGESWGSSRSSKVV